MAEGNNNPLSLQEQAVDDVWMLGVDILTKVAFNKGINLSCGFADEIAEEDLEQHIASIATAVDYKCLYNILDSICRKAEIGDEYPVHSKSGEVLFKIYVEDPETVI